MSLITSLTSLFLFAPAVLAAVSQADFTGLGHIIVLKSDNWQTANPSQKVGCIANDGRFIKDKSKDDCGIFARLNDYPYTLSSKQGNCSFSDEKAEKNKDSYYGSNDYAWSCDPAYEATVYDGLYTIDGFNYPFLCSGDIDCFYDAKKVPEKGDNTSLWPFRWGSQQRGITPGHVQLQLMWDKVGDLPKREGADVIPGPRIELKDGLQVPLRGQQTRP